jgi:hypothetical protein
VPGQPGGDAPSEHVRSSDSRRSTPRPSWSWGARRWACEAQINCPRCCSRIRMRAFGRVERHPQGVCRHELPTGSGARSGPEGRGGVQSPCWRRRVRLRPGTSMKAWHGFETSLFGGTHGKHRLMAPGWEAQESNGRRAVCNGCARQRTLVWSKASRSTGGSLNGGGARARGDAGTATREGKALEGEASAGKPTTDHQRVARRGRKPDEPHGRLQDATSLRTGWQLKPSRWGGTTRADPAHRDNVRRSEPRGEQDGGHQAGCRWRGGSLDNPREGVRWEHRAAW